MENSKQISRTGSVGDAAVEGLLNGIAAGVVMGILIVLMELVLGKAPLDVLSAFDVTNSASPLVGAFTHLAVAGVYGVVFGLVALVVGRLAGARMTLVLWVALGALYGMLIFAVAEWFILPRANSILLAVPPGAFAAAHVVYGVVLAWLSRRSK